MAKLYKLTDKNGQTLNNTQWGPGISHSGYGKGGLCGPGWIHAYEHPLIAVLLNPIHAAFESPLLWEAEGDVGIRDGNLKCGCRTLMTVKKIPLPEVTTEMRIKFAILCAKQVCADPEWDAWADKWLSGEDRTQAAALATSTLAARQAARQAAWAAPLAAARAAAWAAAEADINLFAIAEKACSCSTYASAV